MLLGLRTSKVALVSAILRREPADFGPTPLCHLQPDLVRDATGRTRAPCDLDRHSSCHGPALLCWARMQLLRQGLPLVPGAPEPSTGQELVLDPTTQEPSSAYEPHAPEEAHDRQPSEARSCFGRAGAVQPGVRRRQVVKKRGESGKVPPR